MTSPLEDFRRRHFLTQQEAAKAVGVGLSTWRQIERGFRGRAPPPSLLAHLAALNLLAANDLPWPTPTWTKHGHDDAERP